MNYIKPVSQVKTIPGSHPIAKSYSELVCLN